MRNDLREKGFTLVELAIVMVIIGLLIGAVLKGQAMIDDAKGKRLLNDMQGISAAMYTYLDRYSAVPGDDTSNHGWTGVATGSGDGLITGDNSTDATEAHDAWQALRYAGLLTGDPADTGASHLPKNPFGGSYELGSMSFGSGIGTKNYVRAMGVTGTLAELFDIKHDDGVYNSGSVQASAAFTSATVDLSYAN
ncbi:MAG: type II secretion system protein [Nitrospiraceae bacterium]|nr:MAG: type II secretion system protein [Nitrospiraceae bacterium]